LDFSVKKLIRTLGGIIAPQYFNKISGEFEVQEGSNGASNVQLIGSYGVKANVDATGSLQVKIAGADDTSSGALNVKLADSGIILPVDVQARYPQTIQTHNAVNVPANSGSTQSTWIDCGNFDKVAFTVLNDVATNNNADVHWSNDGIVMHGVEGNAISPGTNQYRVVLLDVKARYVRLRVNNADAAAHTMSAWAYLKA
jgi:hypothetical protein